MLTSLVLASTLVQSNLTVDAIVRDLIHELASERFGNAQLMAIQELGLEAAPALEHAVVSADDYTRSCLASCFAALPNRAGMPTLYRLASSDPSDWVRSASRRELGKVAGSREVDALLGWASDGDLGALEGLGHALDPRAIPTAAKLLGKKFSIPTGCMPMQAYRAGSVLLKLGSAGLAAVHDAISDGTKEQALDGIDALCESEDPKHQDLVVRMVMVEGPYQSELLERAYRVDDRRLCTLRLALLERKPDSWPLLKHALAHKHDEALSKAIRVLAQAKKVASLSWLADSVDTMPQLSKSTLRKALAESVEWDVDESLVRVWAAARTVEATPVLIKMIEETGSGQFKEGWYDSPAKLASCTLASFGVVGFKQVLDAHGKGQIDDDVLDSAVLSVKSPECAPLIRSLLSRSDSLVGTAIRALAELKDGESLQAVMAATERMGKEVGSETTEFLIQISHERASEWVEQYGAWLSVDTPNLKMLIPALIRFAAKNPGYASSYLDCIALFEHSGLIPVEVVRIMLDGDDGQKALAFRVLSGRGDRSVIAVAKRELSGGDVWKRLEAWRALKTLGVSP